MNYNIKKTSRDNGTRVTNEEEFSKVRVTLGQDYNE